MALRRFSEKKLTAEVLRRIRKTKNPRLKQVMTSYIKPLHAFVREVKAAPEEWMQGIQFLTETGHWSTGKRQEFILMSDVLGVSPSLQEEIDRARSDKAQTERLIGQKHQEIVQLNQRYADLKKRYAELTLAANAERQKAATPEQKPAVNAEQRPR